ncbi:MAG: XRE family transcriptional regulator [Methylococcales bacterium]|nr:XRE family transcriptional regulator [Methylococcales bacterium]
MNYDEFRRQIGKAGLTNKAFAELLGLNPKSITNFKTQGGVVPNHLAVIAMFMAEFAERGIDFKKLIKQIKTREDGG